jgi:hypothetical protein
MLQYLYSRHFPQTYIRQTLFCHTKKDRNQMKNAIFSFILVIIIGFLVIAGFFSLAPDGVVFAGFFVVCDNFIFAAGLFSTADFGFVCFFF